MATITIGSDPFVKWKFTCKNAQQKKEKKELAKNFLKHYLKGYESALRQENRFYPKFSFLITNEQFLPTGNGGNVFTYTATVKRKSAPGTTFPNPDSTISPTKPPPPKNP